MKDKLNAQGHAKFCRVWNKRAAWVVLIACGFLSIGQISATPTLVTSRPALGGNDFIDWGGLGPPFTILPDPLATNSDSTAVGAVTTVNNPAGFLVRGHVYYEGWGGFELGDAILWAFPSPGSLDIDFDTPVLGAGAQIQSHFLGHFSAHLTVFDASDNPLATFTLGGNDPAIFLGVLDSDGIGKISFSVDNGRPSFAINRLDLVIGDVGVLQRVPEPSALLLLGVGLLGAFILQNRLKTLARKVSERS